MADVNETWQALAAQLQELRDTVAQQQELRDIIAKQQAQLSAMQAHLATMKAAGPAGRTTAPRRRVARTSRRALLRLGGAAAAATAAAGAAVALGNAQEAHAATGGNFVLGQTNDAGAPTTLTYTGGTSPSALLVLLNTFSTSSVPTGLYVYGAQNGYGVFSSAFSGTGVAGEVTGTGTGIRGTSTSGLGGYFQGGQAPLWLGLHSTPGAPASGTHNAGELYLDSAATIWVCILGGTPGTWVRLASVASGALGGAITLLGSPIRLLDTRPNQPAHTNWGAALSAQQTRSLQVAGFTYSGQTIPSGATGILANVTVLGPSSAGNLAIWPTGGASPQATALTFDHAGVFLANFNIVGVGTGDQINIQNQSGGTTDLVYDAVGYIL